MPSFFSFSPPSPSFTPPPLLLLPPPRHSVLETPSQLPHDALPPPRSQTEASEAVRRTEMGPAWPSAPSPSPCPTEASSSLICGQRLGSPAGLQEGVGPTGNHDRAERGAGPPAWDGFGKKLFRETVPRAPALPMAAPPAPYPRLPQSPRPTHHPGRKPPPTPPTAPLLLSQPGLNCWLGRGGRSSTCPCGWLG